MDLHLTKNGFEEPKDKITRDSFDKDKKLFVRVTCESGAEQSQEKLVNKVCTFMKDNYDLDTENANLGLCSGDKARTDENGNTVYSEVKLSLKLKNGK